MRNAEHCIHLYPFLFCSLALMEFTCLLSHIFIILEGNSNPLQFLAWEIPRTEEFGGYNPRGRKELDTTEPLTLFTFTCQLLNIPAHSSF